MGEFTAEEMILLRDELCADSKSADSIRSTLDSLGNKTMNLDVLVASKIGKAVSALKRHEDEGIQSQAKLLIKQWKNLAAKSGIRPASEPSDCGLSVKRMKVDELQQVPLLSCVIETTVTGNGGLSGSTGGSVMLDEGLDGSVKGAGEEDVIVPDGLLEMKGLLPTRFQMRKKLAEVLGKQVAGNIGTDIIASTSIGVETAVEQATPFTTAKGDYTAKLRSLLFNLKKNQELRTQVLTGAISPDVFVNMKPSELMTREKKSQMEMQAKEMSEARRLDWREKNSEEINKQCGIKNQDGMFKCSRCGSKKTNYFQKQTRSADEPLTTFVTCLNCKKHWKFC
eukprot:542350_1